MSLVVIDILTDVALALVEPIVKSTLGTAVSSAGVATVSPPSMKAIYTGAPLLVARGMASQELITVTSTTASSFTASFVNAHTSLDTIQAPTMPSGQVDHPLFTVAEMLNYAVEAQNSFLLAVRPVYESSAVAGTGVTYITNNRFYTQPSVAIRVERISINGFDLYETTQSDLDLQNANWPVDSGTPTHWFRDQIDTTKFGLYPLPPSGGTLDLWYSKRGPTTLALTDTLVVPDIFRHYIKLGVLARAWSKDGEARDPSRADYCTKRFQMGVVLATRLMEGVGIEMQRQAQQPSFSPMAVPAGVGA